MNEINNSLLREERRESFALHFPRPKARKERMEAREDRFAHSVERGW